MKNEERKEEREEIEITKKMEAIARERYPEIETLEKRYSDDLDFHEVSVWGLKEMLIKAYKLGKEEK